MHIRMQVDAHSQAPHTDDGDGGGSDNDGSSVWCMYGVCVVCVYVCGVCGVCMCVLCVVWYVCVVCVCVWCVWCVCVCRFNH